MLTPPWRVVSWASLFLLVSKSDTHPECILSIPIHHWCLVTDSVVPGHGKLDHLCPLALHLLDPRHFLLLNFFGRKRSYYLLERVARITIKLLGPCTNSDGFTQAELLKYSVKVIVCVNNKHEKFSLNLLLCIAVIHHTLSYYQQATEMGRTTMADRSAIAPLHSHCCLGSPGQQGFQMLVLSSPALFILYHIEAF